LEFVAVGIALLLFTLLLFTLLLFTLLLFTLLLFTLLLFTLLLFTLLLRLLLLLLCGVASMPKERSGGPRLDRSCDWEKYGYDRSAEMEAFSC